eukprot:COSAG01_NODE_1598_length_9772_cov_8.388671_8_plen_166_part_00
MPLVVRVVSPLRRPCCACARFCCLAPRTLHTAALKATAADHAAADGSSSRPPQARRTRVQESSPKTLAQKNPSLAPTHRAHRQALPIRSVHIDNARHRLWPRYRPAPSAPGSALLRRPGPAQAGQDRAMHYWLCICKTPVHQVGTCVPCRLHRRQVPTRLDARHL